MWKGNKGGEMTKEEEGWLNKRAGGEGGGMMVGWGGKGRLVE